MLEEEMIELTDEFSATASSLFTIIFLSVFAGGSHSPFHLQTPVKIQPFFSVVTGRQRLWMQHQPIPSSKDRTLCRPKFTMERLSLIL